MSISLRLLPLLVVGCLLLQSLQPTAVSGQPTTQEKQQANQRLTNHFPIANCDNDVYMPFGVDYSRAQGENYIKHLCQDSYYICYSVKRRTPLFTAQILRGAVLHTARTTPNIRALIPTRAETEYFRHDPRLTLAQRATLNAYSGSGYTRGHLTPAGDMISTANKIEKMNTFILSNMAPQYGRHNKAWERWEKHIRNKATNLQVNVYVITGVTKGNTKIRHYSTAVVVPKHWYKLVAWCQNNVLQAEYIIANHEDADQPTTTWVTTRTQGLQAINGVNPQLKNVQQIQTMIRQHANIRFDIEDLECPVIPVVGGGGATT